MTRRASIRALILAVGLAVTACPQPGPSGDPDASTGDPDGSVTDPTEPLTGGEQTDLQSRMPAAERKLAYDIPHELLGEEDVLYENDVVFELLDADGTRVGFLRDVFTHVSCNGACHAVHFVLLFDTDGAFLEVYNPSGDDKIFMKYWMGEHVPFTEDDHLRLNALVADPPPELVEVEDTATLVVDATVTAATEPAYHDVVVRGAAFTTWTVIHYRLDTQSIMAQVVPEETP